MKPTTLATAILTSGLFLTSHAQLIPFFIKGNADNQLWSKQGPVQKQQKVMEGSPGIQLPGGNDDNNKGSKDEPTGDVILSDVIGNQRQINIFAGFTRDIDSVSKRLDTSDSNTTVLAPLNGAITALPRKPWEDPREYAVMGTSAYDGKDGEDRAHRNLRRFTEAHVIPASPWKEGEKVEAMGGGSVWWEKNSDGKAVVQPGNVEIDSIASRVANGEVWVLKGVLNYAS